MSGKTKIIVLRTKEIIYTVLFAVIGIVLVSLFIFGFTKKSGEKENKNAYIPGVYHASLELGENTMEIEVIVNSNEIHSITMKNTSETVATMYPLMKPALEQISAQIYEKQSLDEITYSDENRYTSMLLLNTIERALEKAQVSEAEDISSASDTVVPEIIY